MNVRTVTTQAELNQALADAVDYIIILSPAYEWLTVTDSGLSYIEARGSSHVVIQGTSNINAIESSHVVAWGKSHVDAWDSSTVTVWDSAHVVTWGPFCTVSVGTPDQA